MELRERPFRKYAPRSLSMDPQVDRSSIPDFGKGRAIKASGRRWAALRRGIAVSVSAGLAALILTSALPPLVADQSDRAVIDAPVALLTAPIAGEVTQLAARAGAELASHANLAEVVNNRVDRSTLITLQGQLSDAQSRLKAIRARRDDDTSFIGQLSSDIARRTAAVEARYAEEIVDLEDQIGAANASMEERRQVRDRQSGMIARGDAAPDMVKAASQQFTAAQFEKDSAGTKLVLKQDQLDSVRQGVFVGDDVHDIAALIEKKRDMELEVGRLGIEEQQVAAEVNIRTRLSDAESSRLASLEHSTIAAPASGEVLSVGASVGRHVSAGDTVARMVDCNAAFVVAIFSYRQGSNLTPGTRVSIAAGPSGNSGGAVMDVLPKTSDKVDDSYAVPFPQTERRELYVLIKPDRPLRSSAGYGDGRSKCDIGRWVTVSRDGGWVPSPSVLWRRAGKTVIRAIGAVVGAADAAWKVATEPASAPADATTDLTDKADIAAAGRELGQNS
jgi:biotin carboxyl carrier protein